MIEKQRTLMSLLFFLLFCFLVSSRSVQSYKNYTVGDTLGWFDSLENPKIDYQKWVSDKTFSLGDFLIFNTDNNHSVIQTHNFTIYAKCDYEDALDNQTVQWYNTNPSADSSALVSVPVPLLKEGMTYFFSSDYDGEQCKNGQRFKINVTHGLGLPESLKAPSDQAQGPISPDSGNEDSAPDTIVPSNFNNPKDVDADVNDDSGAVSISFVMNISRRVVFVTLILLGLVFTF